MIKLPFRCYGRTVVTQPWFYYCLTTTACSNLHYFAPFQHFCDRINGNTPEKMGGKSKQIKAEYGILGGITF